MTASSGPRWAKVRSRTASRSSSRERGAARARWTSFRSLSRPADSRSAAAISSAAERRTIVSDEPVFRASSPFGREAAVSKPSIAITVSESLTRSPALTRAGTRGAAVEQRGVPRAEVLDHPAVALAVEPGVLPRKETVGEDEVGLRGATHHEHVALAEVLEGLADRGRDAQAERDRAHRRRRRTRDRSTARPRFRGSVPDVPERLVGR